MTKQRPKTAKSTKPGEPVTEPEARAAYIGMQGRRSAAKVRKSFVKLGCKTPSLRTFDKWRARHDWVRLAKEHDEKIATGAADALAKDATAQVITRAMQFDTLATETLKMAIDGVAKLDVASLKATDIRALTEVSVSGKRDNLIGLKENVIMGRLIPAGTGCRAYSGIRIEEPEIEEVEQQPEEVAVEAE